MILAKTLPLALIVLTRIRSDPFHRNIHNSVPPIWQCSVLSSCNHLHKPFLSTRILSILLLSILAPSERQHDLSDLALSLMHRFQSVPSNARAHDEVAAMALQDHRGLRRRPALVSVLQSKVSWTSNGLEPEDDGYMDIGEPVRREVQRR